MERQLTIVCWYRFYGLTRESMPGTESSIEKALSIDTMYKSTRGRGETLKGGGL